MIYEFLGKPDSKFTSLVTGYQYDLVVSFNRLDDEYSVEITKPFFCPYTSEKKFNENWRRVE